MPVQDANLIALIPAELGDTGIVADNLTAWMDAYADKEPVPRLRYLYVKRHAVAALMGGAWSQVSFEESGVLRENLSDRIKGLQTLKAEIDADIKLTEAAARGQRAGASGPLTQTAPVTAANGRAQATKPLGSPDANDPAITGSPYRRPWPYRP
jgi:hypothetical protein